MRSAGPSDASSQSHRALEGHICPRCQRRVEPSPDGRLARCPEDSGYVAVSTEALAASDGDPFLGMVVGERFAILERLGAGSMGTVYRAHQEAVGRDVALKIVRSDRLVDPQAKGRFQQEAHATSLLSSPHTVTVFDFGEIRLDDDPLDIDGSLFLAMELLDGESLGERLKRLGRIAPKEAVRIVRHALLSLSEAHDKGIIHRDLKPDNLVLLPGAGAGKGPGHSASAPSEEICKVLDFGIAKLVSHEGGIDALETQAGTVFGTPRYMSPEQAQGKALDARSDIYSLGVILYHMLLGRPPFTDGDAVVVMAHHIKTPPKRPSVADPTLALPAGLEALVMRTLQKDPAHRPQSTVRFIAALDELGEVESAQASSELTAVVASPATSSPRRRALFAGSAVAAVVGLLAAMVVTERPTARATTGLSLAAGGAMSRAILAIQGRGPAEEPAEALSDSPLAPPSVAPASSQPSPREEESSRGYERFDR